MPELSTERTATRITACRATPAPGMPTVSRAATNGDLPGTSVFHGRMIDDQERGADEEEQDAEDDAVHGAADVAARLRRLGGGDGDDLDPGHGEDDDHDPAEQRADTVGEEAAVLGQVVKDAVEPGQRWNTYMAVDQDEYRDRDDLDPREPVLGLAE